MSSQMVYSLCSSSSSSSSNWKFDVFLSFRGEDTRKNFTDHLYNSLMRGGINVYRDVVFSKNYAYSTWCLDELVKIVECMMTKGQVIIPIFYDVNPILERENKGNFQKSLAKHEEAFRNNTEKVEKWRSALMEVINLPGKELKDRYESEFIEDIVKEILSKISSTSTSTLMMNLQKLVAGMSPCLEKLWMQAQMIREREFKRANPQLPQLSIPFFF